MANKVIWLFVIAAFSAGAQEKTKPQPPPPRLAVPDDSTKTGAREKKDAGEQPAEKLQLPDVLIYGKDTEVRTTGQKITVSPDRLTVEPPTSGEAPRDSAAALLGSKASLQQESKTSPNNFRASLAGGAFGQLEVTAHARAARMLAQKDRRIEVSAGGNVNRADGQFANSDFREWHVEASAGYNWREASAVQLKIGGGNRQYGFYGAVNPELDAEVQKFSSEGHVRLPAGSTAEFTVSGQWQFDNYDYLQNGAAPDESVDERVSLLRATFEKRFRRAALQFAVESLSDRLDFPPRSTDLILRGSATNRLSQFSGEVRFPAGRSFTITTGGRLTHAQSQGREQESRFGPLLRVVAVPRQRLALSAEFSNGWRYTTLTTRWSGNPYLAANKSVLPEEVTANLALAAEYRLVRGWVLKAQYSRVAVRGLNYYEREGATGLFALRQLDEVTLVDITLGMEMNFGDQFLLSGALHFLNDDIDDPGLPVFADVPYRGEIWLPAKLEYLPTPKTRVVAEARLVGSRRITLIDNTKLDGYLEVRGRGEWKALQSLTLFAEGRNLLDNSFEKWQGYREIGLNFVAGLAAAW